MDIYSVAEQLFPKITEGIFYGDALPQLKKSIILLIKGLKKLLNLFQQKLQLLKIMQER